MEHTVGLAVAATAWAWLAAEILLQVRQRWRSERTERSEWRSLLVFVVLAVVGVNVAGPLHRALPALSYHLGTGLGVLLLVVGWAGIALRLSAIITLGRFFRGTVHIQHDHTVVRSGPYRWVRHPAYSGLLLAVAALAVFLGNVMSWLVCLGCFLLATLYRIRVEERVLTEALGKAYTDYAAQTRRLVPGVW
jgi:protein-S-isoprenylcysteine O-methyltransferase Ste14